MRRWLVAAAVVVAFAAVYALSRHTTGPSGTTTTSTTSSAPTTSTTTNPTSSATTCSPGDFNAVYDEGEGAVGIIYAGVTLTKTTAGTCTLEGWPLLTLQDHLGGVIPIQAVDVPTKGQSFKFMTPAENAAPTTLTIAKAQEVQFALAYSDVPVGTAVCPSATTLSVQFVANGATAAVTPTYAVQPCQGARIWLSPFFPD